MISSRLLLAGVGILAFSAGCAHTSRVAREHDANLMVKAGGTPERALEDSVAVTTDSVEAPLPLYLPTGASFQGHASWYNRRTNGGSATASGERLQDTAFTAAHRTLPFGTVSASLTFTMGNQRSCASMIEALSSAVVLSTSR